MSPDKTVKKTDALLKKFLEGLAATLDVKETALGLGLSGGEAKRLLRLAAEKLSGPVPVEGHTELFLYVDGASRGNPGEAGAGAVIEDADGNTIKNIRKRLGVATNNVAEYTALVLALKEAKKMEAESVKVFADSELIVKQMKGAYRVKNEGLKPLYAEAMRLAEGFFSFEITHIKRARNAGADRLANEAIDGV